MLISGKLTLSFQHKQPKVFSRNPNKQLSPRKSVISSLNGSICSLVTNLAESAMMTIYDSQKLTPPLKKKSVPAVQSFRLWSGMKDNSSKSVF